MSVLKSYLDFCRRFTWQILTAVGLLTLAAALLASSLEIKSDITRLLPSSAPSVAGLERLEESYGGQIGRLTVVLEADANATPQLQRSPEDFRALAEKLAQSLRGVEGVDRVQTRRPMAFFKKYRLLYADTQDLRDAQSYLNRRLDRAEGRANPLFVGLDDAADPAASAAEAPNNTPPPALLNQQRLAKKYPAFFQTPYYIAENGSFLAFFVYPDFPPSDLKRSAELVARVERVVSQGLGKLAAAPSPAVRVGLTGRYKKRVDLAAMIKRDLTLSTSVALGILLVFLWLYLGSFRATFLVLTPVVVGACWTFAWASIAFGSLNIMTAFLGAVLMGLGVDYGVHFFSRFRELSHKLSAQDALLRVFASTGRANIAAAFTTMIALGSLMISSFRAFYEFGVIAVGGLPLILIAYFVLFPCAVGVAERWGIDLTRTRTRSKSKSKSKSGDELQRSERASGKWDGKFIAWIESGTPAQARRRLARMGGVARLLLILLVLAAAIGLPRLEFTQNFSVLQSTSAPSWQLDKRINAMLGQSQTPTLILTDSQAQSALVMEELRRRKAQHIGPALIDKVVSLQSFVPADQTTKRALLAQIARRLRELPKNSRNQQLQGHLDEIEQLLRAEPIAAMELPEQIRQQFSRRDSGNFDVSSAPADQDAANRKGVVLVFPAVDLSNVAVIDAWARTLKDLPGVDSEGGYDAISESFLLRDIVRTAKADAEWMVAITLVGLVLLSVFVLRNIWLIILQLAALALALLVALGINGLVGSNLNFMNIVALPVWLGLAVDATFHLLLLGRRDKWKSVEEQRDFVRSHLCLSLAISVAYLTSMIGFGTLLFAQHNGLFSLGMLAVFGLGAILCVNLLIQIILVAEGAHTREKPFQIPRRSP